MWQRFGLLQYFIRAARELPRDFGFNELRKQGE